MKLLLAEDTTDLNAAITTVLEHHDFEVDSAFDGQEAFDYLMDHSYDVVILDIMMPKMDGLQVLKQMRDMNIMTPVLLLTAKNEVDDRVHGLDAGADDYLPKPFAMKELLARIRSLVRRNAVDVSMSYSFGNVTLNRNQMTLEALSSIGLSNHEFELMSLLASHSTSGVRTSDILHHVWKEEDAGEDTVVLYINYLQRKLESIGACARIVSEEDKYRLVEVKHE